jgi:predicted amidophosphoribosyltransferase
MSEKTSSDQHRRAELRFRQPMAVREVLAFRTGDSYPVCPQCGITMEREYQHFCDRCGQRLDWADFRHAQILVKV